MSDMLNIGASGVRAYQTALSTTSDNIANASTPGFVRRTTNQIEVGAYGHNSGSGVSVTGIGRVDVAVQADTLRSTTADLSRTQSTITWLDQLDSGLSGQDLTGRLADFFNASDQVAADPTASAPRSVMLENATSVAQAFTATGKTIDRLDQAITVQGQGYTDQLNAFSTSLAKVNGNLGRAGSGTGTRAALLDERDQLLQQMSSLTDVSVSFDNFGRATVKGGSTSGPVLVQGDQTSTVSFARNSDGAVAYKVVSNDGASVLSPTGGAMAGLSEGAQRIAHARDQLDGMASDFADGVNAVQANGRDLNNGAGEPIFSVDPANPSNMSVVMTDVRGIAAASVGGGPRDNSNLANLTSLRSSGDFENKFTSMVSANGAALSARQTVADAQTTIRDQAQASLDAKGGVDLDQQAVDLIRFQQAYQASSRVIQVARETLQTLFQIS